MNKHRAHRFFGCAFAVSALALAASSCKRTHVIEPGSTVKIDYKLSANGHMIESSEGKAPLLYVDGSRQIIPGLEKGLEGLKRGDHKSVVVSPSQGYGDYNPAAIQKVPRKAFMSLKGLKPGMVVNGQKGQQRVRARVLTIDKTFVTLDFNHPLAGTTLYFDVTIVDVQPGSSAAQRPSENPLAGSKE